MDFDAETLNKYWTDIYFLLHSPHNDRITSQGIRILQLVEKREKVGISEISSFLAVSPNTASENVKRLIEKNYLIKTRDPSDERKVILKITDFGKEVLQSNTSLDKEKLVEIFNDLSPDEQALLESAFKLLKNRADYVRFDFK